jgi:hypothetical protein
MLIHPILDMPNRKNIGRAKIKLYTYFWHIHIVA